MESDGAGLVWNLLRNSGSVLLLRSNQMAYPIAAAVRAVATVAVRAIVDFISARMYLQGWRRRM